MNVQIPEKVVIQAIQQQYFTRTEAANFLGVSYPTFVKWIKEEPIKTVEVYGQILFAKDELIRFMEDHTR